MTAWEKFMTADELAKELNYFLECYPYEEPPPPASSTEGQTKQASKNKFIGKNIWEWSEEEQLKLAAELSLKSVAPENEGTEDDETSEEKSEEKKPKKRQRSPERTTEIEESGPKKQKVESEKPKPKEVETKNPKEKEEKPEEVASKKESLPKYIPQEQMPKPKLKQLPVDIKEADSVLQLKFPDSPPIVVGFKSDATLHSVLEYAKENKQLVGEYALVSNFPKKKYSGNELNLTLKEIGLSGRTALFVEKI
eukprot:TRINITY_DN6995_c0_g1_i2.p1 TRINITY_DN6995_c0_g1~~TRINITY_DN6995_c0_g1_i2.p1  ORF type:complete len:252 (+),score=113.92 TRINITY_DN6995_c0_g1_i2:595-1350(+)